MKMEFSAPRGCRAWRRTWRWRCRKTHHRTCCSHFLSGYNHLKNIRLLSNYFYRDLEGFNWLGIIGLPLPFIPWILSSCNQATGFVLTRCLNPGPSICSDHKSVWWPPVSCQFAGLIRGSGERDPAQDEDTVVTACLSGEEGRKYSISS